MNIELLQASLKEDTDPGLATFDPRFSDIITLTQEARYEDAATKAEEIIALEIYDIRIIGYFLYGHFLEQGVGAMAEIYLCLTDLLGEQLAALGPVKKREKHIQSILNWLMKQLHKKMQYEETKNSDTYQYWIEQATTEQIQQALDAGDELRHVLGLVLEDAAGAVLDGLLNVNDWLRAFQPLVYREQEEPEEEDASDQGDQEDTSWDETEEEDEQLEDESAEELEQETEPASFNVAELASEGSYALNLLLKKLDAFEQLIADGKYSSAALIADDVNSMLSNFDPKLYFPRLFTRFSLLFACHINELTAYQASRDTVQWQALQELYKVDLESFVNFDPDCINLEAASEMQGYKQPDEYASSDDQDYEDEDRYPDEDEDRYPDEDDARDKDSEEDEW